MIYRLMVLCIRRANACFVVIVSAYKPTMQHSDEIKEAFYENLKEIICSVPQKDKLLILGDFNSRIVTDYQIWDRVLGCHGIGKCNSKQFITTLCAQNKKF